MSELIQEYSYPLMEETGKTYALFVYGEEQPDGTWEGWIEFHPRGRAEQILRTDRETTQPDKSALAYWASGLEPVYFEGAFERARSRE